jgi:hypothetical protein
MNTSNTVIDHNDEHVDYDQNQNDIESNHVLQRLLALTPIDIEKKKMKKNSSLDLQLLNLIPVLKEIKDHGSSFSRKQILVESLSIRAIQLVDELSSIKIQSCYRRYKNQKVLIMKKIKKKWNDQYAKVLVNRFIDEISVSFSVEISMELVEYNEKKNLERAIEEENINDCCKELLLEVTTSLYKPVAQTAIKENARLYMVTRPQVNVNPLVAVIISLCEEAADSFVIPIAKRSIHEEVNLFLEQRQAFHLSEKVIFEIVNDMSISIINEGIKESKEDFVLYEVLNNVILEQGYDISTLVLSSMQEEILESQKQADIREIGESVKRNIGKRLVVGHLMMGISNLFENIIMEYYVKGVARRIAIARILAVIEGAESQISNIKESTVLRSAASQCIIPTLRGELYSLLLDKSKYMESYIDDLEEQAENNFSKKIINSK